VNGLRRSLCFPMRSPCITGSGSQRSLRNIVSLTCMLCSNSWMRVD
jgi:hypothetical protein